jgi:DNA-binding response OmpR family regulator
MPDLVIADVNMPRKSGFSFLEEVRGSKSGKFLPVVMMTSSSQAVDYHKSLMTRANTFITKPNTYDELSRVLKKLIRAFIWQESLPTLFSAGEDRSALAASVTNSSATMH